MNPHEIIAAGDEAAWTLALVAGPIWLGVVLGLLQAVFRRRP